MFFLFSTSAWGNETDLSDILIKAEIEKSLVPVLSAQYTDLNMTRAYQIQKVYILKKLKNKKNAGFKAGLTSLKLQKRFGVTSPLAVVLFESGKLDNHTVVSKEKFHKLMLETEIGFVIVSVIDKPLKHPNQLRKYIK